MVRVYWVIRTNEDYSLATQHLMILCGNIALYMIFL